MRQIISLGTQKEKRQRKILIATAILMVLGVALWAFYGAQVRAADNFINVTTTVDEDSDPGAGCSLYEATVAAASYTAYGGCEPGVEGDVNIIVVPAGTYLRDVDNGPTAELGYPDVMRLELGNASLQGAGIGQTIIDGYSIDVAGDEAAFLSDVSITTNATINMPAYIWISGSNKTISSVELGNGSMTPAEMTFVTESGQVLTNTLIENTNIIASESTNPAVTIQCTGDGNCEDISFNNVNVESAFSTTIGLGGVSGVSITDSAFNVLTCSSTSITLGAGAHVDGLEQSSCATGDGGSAYLTIESADVVRNVTQSTDANGSIGLDVSTPTIDNYTVYSNSTVTLTNDYEGSVLSNVDIQGSSAVIGSFGELYAQAISNVSITQTTSYVTFSNTYNGAVIEDVTIEYTGDSSYPSVDLIGDDMVVDGMQVVRVAETDGVGQGVVEVQGSGVQLRNINLVDTELEIATDGEVLLEKFTINGPSHLFGIWVYGDGYDVTIRDGYVHSSREAVYATAGTDSGAELLVQNVMIENVGSEWDGPGAMYIDGVDYVTIRDVTINEELQAYGAPIFIIDGASHVIANTTIADSSRGMLLFSSEASASPMEVLVNNVTIANNADSVAHQESEEPSSFIVDSTAGRTINVAVMNSVFAGNSPYTPCVTSDDTNITVSNSFAQHSSCESLGFTVLSDPGLVTTLADNNTQRSAVGYNSADGYVQTLALEESSILVGAGDVSTCEATDARGVERTVDSGCDVGAFQLSVAVVDDEDEQETENSGSGGGSGSGSEGSENQGPSGGQDVSVEQQPLTQLPPNTGDEPTSSDDDENDPDSENQSQSGDSEGIGAENTESEESGDVTFWIVTGTAVGIIAATSFALSVRARPASSE